MNFELIGTIRDAAVRETFFALRTELNRLEALVASAGNSGFASIVNTAGTALLAGSVCGYSGGRMALACADDAAYVGAQFVVKETAGANERFVPAARGEIVLLRTGGGGGWSFGGAVYLATSAGVATSTRPTTPDRTVILGSVAGEEEDDGRIPVNVFVELRASR